MGCADGRAHSPIPIHAWHDFYLLVGTASATLVGLMFVTATIGAQLFTERNTEWSLDALAAAVITLLLAGIRNAWDMTLWIVIRVPVSESRNNRSS